MKALESLVVGNGSLALRYELILLVLLVFLAGALAYRMNRRSFGGDALSQAGLRRLAFPLLGFFLVGLAQLVARLVHSPLQLAGIVTQLLLAMAAVRIVIFALRRALPSSEAWFAGLEKTVASLIWLGVALDLLGMWPEIIAWLDSIAISLGKSRWSLWAVLQGAASVLTTLVVALWIGGLLEARLMAAPTLDSSLKVVFSRALKAVLILVAVLLGMSLAGLDVTTLSVFSGALGVGLGLGMQKIASNYVAGFIILLDRSIRIGNIIQLAPDQRGEVKQITTRYTVLRAPNGAHFIVPNDSLIASVVINETFLDRRVRVVLRLNVVSNADVEAALAIMEAVAQENERVLRDPPPSALLAAFEEAGVALELVAWIESADVGVGALRSALGRQILLRFRHSGIALGGNRQAMPMAE